VKYQHKAVASLLALIGARYMDHAQALDCNIAQVKKYKSFSRIVLSFYFALIAT